MIWLCVGLVVGYLLLDRRRLRRERNAMQMLWLDCALKRREEQVAAQEAFDQLMEEQFGSERLESGQVLLPPMSLN